MFLSLEEQEFLNFYHKYGQTKKGDKLSRKFFDRQSYFVKISFKGQINKVAKNLSDKGYIEEEFSLTEMGEKYFRGKNK